MILDRISKRVINPKFFPLLTTAIIMSAAHATQGEFSSSEADHTPPPPHTEAHKVFVKNVGDPNITIRVKWWQKDLGVTSWHLVPNKQNPSFIENGHEVGVQFGLTSKYEKIEIDGYDKNNNAHLWNIEKDFSSMKGTWRCNVTVAHEKEQVRIICR